MTYTSSFTIGSADDDDYATLQLWFDDVRGSLGNGEHALATLVPSGPGDSFDWYAARYFGDNTHYTVSGNATPNDFTSYRVDNDGVNSFNNDGGDAGQHSTFNAIGISFAPSSSSNELIRINANPANEGDITFTFDRCQFDQTYTGISTRRIINDNRFTSLSSTYTFEFSSCVIKSDDTGRVYASYFISPASSFTVTRYVGCTFDLPQNTKVGSIDPANSNVVHTVEVSGCLLNLDEFYSKKTGNVLSGVSVDNITRQSSATHADTFNDVTNATYNATFNYGTAPAAGEVSFNATSPNTYQYPTFEGDYTLYDDSNNLAIGYVTNSTLPSPDLAGNTRGTPYDAGAFALTLDGGGEDFPPESGGVALPLTFAYRININD